MNSRSKTRRPPETTWNPSEEAWHSVEKRWEGSRRESVPIRALGRVKHDRDNVQRRPYEEMRFDKDTPPVLVGFRKDKYVLIDGHHRVLGAKLKKFGEVPAIVVPGMHPG